jgi:hypothetical protein
MIGLFWWMTMSLKIVLELRRKTICSIRVPVAGSPMLSANVKVSIRE